MNRLSTAKQSMIVSLLVEGNSIRSTCRLTGHSKNTVIKLLCDLGQACLTFQEKTLRDLPCKRIQCDEIWAFCRVKDRNLKPEHQGTGVGSVWTYTSICPDTKIVPCWLVAERDAASATRFLLDLRSRLSERVQLTSDGFKPYLEAVRDSFGEDVDYAMLKKVYGGSPNHIIETQPTGWIGMPDLKHVSTSLCERQNLTIRMSNRRFTRKTNGFSKKIENHRHGLSIYFMYYNFIRVHQTLKTAPAVACGLIKSQWTTNQMLDLLEA